MKTEVKTITPEIAKQYLKSNTMNRPKKDKMIQMFIGFINRGEWKLTHQGIAFSQTGRLLDGQNRLHAIAMSGKSVKMMVTTGLPDECMTVIDSGVKRTTADSFHLLEVPNANYVSAGIGTYIKLKLGNSTAIDGKSGTLTSTSMSNEEKYHLYLDNQQLMEKCVWLAGKCYSQSRLFAHSVVMGFSLFLILERKHSYAKVMKFWLNVFMVENDNITPCRLLSKVMIKSETSREKLKPEIKLVYLIKAWNAYTSGDHINMLRYNPNESRPEVL